ncbi:MAG: DUF4230 domain-containing protein [Gemmatimonadaceae bacterium]
MREVAKLVSFEMTLRDVVTYEQTQLRSTKRALLVVAARVSSGIDLGKGTNVHTRTRHLDGEPRDRGEQRIFPRRFYRDTLPLEGNLRVLIWLRVL